MNSASRNPRWLAFLALAMTWKRAVTFDLQTASLHWLEVFRWRVIPLSDFETFRTFRFRHLRMCCHRLVQLLSMSRSFPWLPPSALSSPWFAVFFVFVVVFFLLFFLFFFFSFFFGFVFWDLAALIRLAGMCCLMRSSRRLKEAKRRTRTVSKSATFLATESLNSAPFKRGETKVQRFDHFSWVFDHSSRGSRHLGESEQRGRNV